MRKLYKVMTFENISIELDDPAEAKEISRVKLTIYEDNDRCNYEIDIAKAHGTKMYADIKENKLAWE